MKFKSIILSVFIIAFTAGIAVAEMTGTEIMQKAFDIDIAAKTIQTTIKLEYIKKGEVTKETELLRLHKKYPDIEKTIVVFSKPADVAGVAILNYNYVEFGKDDDQWLYMPALKKVRRITTSSKGEYFMGTEYTYEDMAGDVNADEDVNTLEGTETIDGHDCYKIISVPKDKDSMYSKKMNYVEKDTFKGYRTYYYDQDGELLKILTIKKWDFIDNIWCITSSEMKNVQKDRATVIYNSNMKFNMPVDDSIFTQRTLPNAIQRLSAQ